MKNLTRTLLPVLLVLMSVSGQAQVPQLSSLPSASPTIYLDFDGHLVTGTSWNYMGPIECGASGLSAEQITVIFNRIAEDYRPFEVNITTDSTKFLAAPVNRRMRAIFTVSSSWYGSAGGVAYVNSFSWGDDTPCFIFSLLLNNNVKNISEAASHEVGHTLGLRHQAAYDANCVKTSDYNYGQGSGEIGWAPIMGVGYYQNFTLWHNGPTSSGCNNYQNDLTIITSATNGISFRNDDHFNDASGATNLTLSGNQFIINGIIEKTDDTDVFRFTVPSSGQFTLNAIPYNVGTGHAGSDLDMQVELLDDNQQLVGTYNPGNILGSVIDTFLTAGEYFLRVEGKGNLYAPEYGSLGSYSLQATYTQAEVLAVRKIELSGNNGENRHQLNWVIDADERVIKQVLEASSDRNSFTAIAEITPGLNAFAYTPATASRYQYRLKVKFNNGREYYSNVVAITQQATAAKPVLAGNFITTNSITVNSPGQFAYTLIDVNGKAITKGSLNIGVNKIDISHLSHGLFIIRFNNEREQWIEKLLKQ